MSMMTHSMVRALAGLMDETGADEARRAQRYGALVVDGRIVASEHLELRRMGEVVWTGHVTDDGQVRETLRAVSA